MDQLIHSSATLCERPSYLIATPAVIYTKNSSDNFGSDKNAYCIGNISQILTKPIPLCLLSSTLSDTDFAPHSKFEQEVTNFAMLYNFCWIVVQDSCMIIKMYK